MDRSVAFFRDVLKLESGYTSPYWSDFKLGTIRLGIHLVFDGNEAPAVIPFKNAIIGIETDDLANLRKILVLAGDHIRGEYHQTPSGVILDFIDPEGNNFQAIQVGSKLKDFVS